MNWPTNFPDMDARLEDSSRFDFCVRFLGSNAAESAPELTAKLTTYAEAGSIFLARKAGIARRDCLDVMKSKSNDQKSLRHKAKSLHAFASALEGALRASETATQEVNVFEALKFERALLAEKVDTVYACVLNGFDEATNKCTAANVIEIQIDSHYDGDVLEPERLIVNTNSDRAAKFNTAWAHLANVRQRDIDVY